MDTRKTWLKRTAFGLAGLLICVLMAATFVEKTHGREFASQHLYRSPAILCLWALTALSGLIYIIRCKLQRHYATFALHVSFLLILSGALITHLTGVQGQVHLRRNEAPTRLFLTSEGVRRFPFALSLREFTLSYYPGTLTPMDFTSRIDIEDPEGNKAVQSGTVSMNRILRYRHYRFYQSGYDNDGGGSTLSVAYDPYGIAVTYAGYGLLLLSMLLFFLQRNSGFRKLLRHPLLRKGTTLCMLAGLFPATAVSASERDMPQTLPAETAAQFGKLYIYYNGRICPLQTMARDFTVKLYGKERYRGLTAEQVLTGWFFYYDDWKAEPMIRIKDKRVRQRLDTESPYARLTDFVGNDGYKLQGTTENRGADEERKSIEEANEKFNLVSMLCTGHLLRIYPCREKEHVVWYSPADKLPADTPEEQWVFIRSSLNYMAEHIYRKDYATTEQLLQKTKAYQRKEAAGALPSDARFQAERIYNALGCNRPVAILSLLAGLVFFALCLRNLLSGRHPGQPSGRTGRTASALTLLLWLYLTVMLVLRGYVSGHLPLANGFETMMFMAWCSATATLAARRRFPMALPFGFVVCGLTLLVATMGESNPQITLLMPVLSSPLLSLHVVVIMIAYSLLAFTLLNGLTALLLHGQSRRDYREQVEYLRLVSLLLLYPAVFLLAAGIFIGAVWANVSWGRYWGWDPKEVWALITLLVYAAALHGSSLPRFRRPLFFHTFCVAAFLTVLITYFGVNFLLGGMHSYAAG